MTLNQLMKLRSDLRDYNDFATVTDPEYRGSAAERDVMGAIIRLTEEIHATAQELTALEDKIQLCKIKQAMRNGVDAVILAFPGCELV